MLVKERERLEAELEALEAEVDELVSLFHVMSECLVLIGFFRKESDSTLVIHIICISPIITASARAPTSNLVGNPCFACGKTMSPFAPLRLATLLDLCPPVLKAFNPELVARIITRWNSVLVSKAIPV